MDQGPTTGRTVFATLLIAVGVLLVGCAVRAATPRASAPEASRSAVLHGSAASPARLPTSMPPVHAVAARADPCAGNHGRLVRVSLATQHLWMCDGPRLARGTAITSGRSGPDTATPRGHYRIQGLNRHSTLTLSSGAQYDVQYWIPFDAPDFGFHDASWQHFPYGSPRYRTDGSHGCVHMPLAAIAFLYQWAEIGTRVTIT